MRIRLIVEITTEARGQRSPKRHYVNTGVCLWQLSWIIINSRIPAHARGPGLATIACLHSNSILSEPQPQNWDSVFSAPDLWYQYQTNLDLATDMHSLVPSPSFFARREARGALRSLPLHSVPSPVRQRAWTRGY